jgi:DNA gyrase subunit A
VNVAKEIIAVNLEDEMKKSYLDYAMSVIVGRALPDVRDGLKPVHRRVLFAMKELTNEWNKPYKKSARIVGDVIGKYHPHGDSAVYDAIVRMAQDFSMSAPLIDGQGNFGSVDGDSPAAMRYTEIRMAKLSSQIIADLDKETVDFIPNYDDSEREPAVFPSKIPNLLINGSSGIAVGMATNIPPHNLVEVMNGLVAMVDKPEIDISELMEHIKGPDFPTAAIINGTEGIHDAYRSGRGRIIMRAKYKIEDSDKKKYKKIIINEIPYQVNKAETIKKISQLVKDKKIVGIKTIADESDKDGMRIAITIQSGEVPEIIMNNLYKLTLLQKSFGVNMVALVNGKPQLLNLLQVLKYFIKHRKEVVSRRTIFELKKAQNRAHILEGLAISLANIDEVIELIKKSPSPAIAKTRLLTKIWQPGQVLEMLQKTADSATRPVDVGDEYGLSAEGYKLSALQAQAILDLRLHRLTGLEQEKLISEYEEIIKLINRLLEILQKPAALISVIRSEFIEIKEMFDISRRSEIQKNKADISYEDLIADEEVLVTFSYAGYCKAQSLSDYKMQKRGGRGKSATKMKDEDFIDKLFIANTHDNLLCFSSKGKVYWKKVYELPFASRGSRGKPLVNLLPLDNDEKINAVLPIRQYTEGSYIFMATANGMVKKTALPLFSNQRANGIIAINLKDGNSLIDVALTTGDTEIMLFSSGGSAVRFNEKDVRPIGRTGAGVKGMNIKNDEKIISLIVANDGDILTATENGFGKRTSIEQYRLTKRGGKGVKSIQTSKRNGTVIGAVQVQNKDGIMLITNLATLVRTSALQVPKTGRATQGVRLIRLSDTEKLSKIAKICDVDN